MAPSGTASISARILFMRSRITGTVSVRYVSIRLKTSPTVVSVCLPIASVSCMSGSSSGAPSSSQGTMISLNCLIRSGPGHVLTFGVQWLGAPSFGLDRQEADNGSTAREAVAVQLRVGLDAGVAILLDLAGEPDVESATRCRGRR
jgi:hypothetical protein